MYADLCRRRKITNVQRCFSKSLKELENLFRIDNVNISSTAEKN